MEILKKYLYTGILLGTFVLAGCVNEEPESEETAESLADGQTTEIKRLSDTEKVKEVVAPTPINLTQDQKENYYKEYVATVEKVNAEFGVDFKMEPITEFLDEYWVEVEDFEEMVKERANASIVVSKSSEIYSPTLVPKTAKLHIGSNVTTIIFKGSFETQINSNTPDGRQLFSKFNSISSEIEGNDGSWIQTGYDSLLIDNGISYVISVGGKYSQSGVISSHNIEVEFHCNKNGAIS